MASMINVLISLHRGYGLGDAVQMSSVLRHVAKYRPLWHVDFQAEAGRACVGNGIVNGQCFVYGEPNPSYYDAEVQILLYDTWANWGDRPNTRVSSCLHERFDLPWDASCGRYQVNVSERALVATSVITRPDRIGSGRGRGNGGRRQNMWHKEGVEDIKPRMVAFHYQGDSSPAKKNLTHEQASIICNDIEKLGWMPLLLDWRDASPLAGTNTIRTVGKLPTSREWGASAEMNCAVISRCAAFIGIDSGPSKCASATDTPALVIWTGHHPAPFHDPAPNTTHLVPRNYHGLEPVCNNQGVIDWFENNYNVRTYDRDPVREVKKWLEETLNDRKIEEYSWC